MPSNSISDKLFLFFALAILTLTGAASVHAQNNNKEESISDRFYRKGGKTAKAEVISRKWELTTISIAQERDLSIYDNGGHFNCYMRYQDETDDICDIPKARDFIWQHWQNKQRGYIRITFGTIDAKSTSHIFIEPNEQGTWHVAWRMVRHSGEITDTPDIRSVKQRRATKDDIECDCKPGTIIITFIDWEGEEIQTL